MNADAHPDLSFDRLNAFVDGELDTRDEGRVLAAIQCDPLLSQQVSQLRMSKDLVRHAYQTEAPATTARRQGLRAGWSPLAATATVLVAVGVGAGWAGHAWQLHDDGDYSRLARQPGIVTQAAASDRILPHVSTSAPERVAAMLDGTEGMLAAARRSGRPIAILANSTGLGAKGTACEFAQLRSSTLALGVAPRPQGGMAQPLRRARSVHGGAGEKAQQRAGFQPVNAVAERLGVVDFAAGKGDLVLAVLGFEHDVIGDRVLVRDPQVLGLEHHAVDHDEIGVVHRIGQLDHVATSCHRGNRQGPRRDTGHGANMRAPCRRSSPPPAERETTIPRTRDADRRLTAPRRRGTFS